LRRRARCGGSISCFVVCVPGGVEIRRIISTWTNVAFSADGLRKLTSDAEVTALPDASFRGGLLAQSRRLRDPTDPAREGNPANWKVGAPGKVPDVLVIVASDDLSCLAKVVGRISDLGGAGQPVITWQEQGDSRPDLPGHEHFGFRDGISQPAVRGRVSAEPEEFFAERSIDVSDSRAAGWVTPGRPLVPPGHFVLGYPIDHEMGEVIGPLRSSTDGSRTVRSSFSPPTSGCRRVQTLSCERSDAIARDPWF
jgi:hypothetical protein